MRSDHRFVTLDGMRGLAALLVAIAHIGELVGVILPPHGALAVDFFFVLSGFVLAQAYEDRLSNGMTPLDFMRVRVIRLYPLLALGSGISALIYIGRSLLGAGPGIAATLWTMVAAILFIPFHALPSAGAFPLDGPAWSLFAEFWVNILFAFIAASLTAKRLCWLLAAGLGGLLLLFNLDGGLENLWRSDQAGLSILRVVYPFFAGVLLSRIYRSGRLRLPKIAPIVSLSILAAILLAPATRFDAVFDFLMVVAVLPALVLGSTADEMGPGQRKLLLLGGALSYPTYILHYPVARLLGGVLVEPTVFASWGAAGLTLYMLCLIATCYVVLRYADQPVRAWLGSRWRSREVRALPA